MATDHTSLALGLVFILPAHVTPFGARKVDELFRQMRKATPEVCVKISQAIVKKGTESLGRASHADNVLSQHVLACAQAIMPLAGSLDARTSLEGLQEHLLGHAV